MESAWGVVWVMARAATKAAARAAAPVAERPRTAPTVVGVHALAPLAALDPRVALSFPIAGSIPLDFHHISWDFEQQPRSVQVCYE